MTLPQTCIALGRMLTLTAQTLDTFQPNAQAMQVQMGTAQGSIYAEALTFTLARQMPRPAAEAEAKSLLAMAQTYNRDLLDTASARHPQPDVQEIRASSSSTAAQDARRFARAVRTMLV